MPVVYDAPIAYDESINYDGAGVSHSGGGHRSRGRSRSRPGLRVVAPPPAQQRWRVPLEWDRVETPPPAPKPPRLPLRHPIPAAPLRGLVQFCSAIFETGRLVPAGPRRQAHILEWPVQALHCRVAGEPHPERLLAAEDEQIIGLLLAARR